MLRLALDLGGTAARDAASGAGYATTTTIQGMAGSVIGFLLSFLGVVFLILVMYAGWLWMTAGGDDKKVGKAKTLVTQAVIGFVVILSAYAITQLVMGILNPPSAFPEMQDPLEPASIGGCPHPALLA